MKDRSTAADVEEASGLARGGDFGAAEQRCQTILRSEPHCAEALLLRGVIEWQTGRREAAIRSISTSIRHQPERPIAHAVAGDVLLASGRAAEALQAFDQALRLGLRAEAVHFGRGNALLDLARAAEAVGSFDAALQLNVGHAEAHFNRGIALLSLRRPEDALGSFDRAIELRPTHAAAHSNRGSALLALGRADEALVAFEEALRHRPDLADAWSNRGLTLARLGRPADALVALERAIELRPELAEAHLARADVLRADGRFAEALQGYDEARRLRPGSAEAECGRANVLLALGSATDAADAFAAVLTRDPARDFIAGALLHAQACAADWSERLPGYHRDWLREAVLDGERVDAPFSFLSISDSGAAQLRCARTYLDALCRPREPLCCGKPYRHERIRIAYLSGDFREHAVSYLMAGVWDRHDRRYFETFGISLREPESSPMGRRASAAFDRFLDLSRHSDQAVAELLRDLEVDIAVDLTGYTRGMRPDILLRRPAPIQVNYLGFPATMGNGCIDYLLADRYVVTPGTRRFYTERIVELPDCYQANDDRRALSARPLTRGELGLPERGFVFCCLNNTYKINPSMFDVWMRILGACPGSVLWLVDSGERTRMNLRREAAARGIGGERLVFAPRWPYEEHLARQRFADLFLDTLPFNGGTTVSDALYSGLPVLTCSGEAYASRMAGSLLTTLGLCALVTASLEEYADRAIELARSTERLSALRRQLDAARSTGRVFDTDRFRRHLESAYRQMIAFSERGEPAQDFRVSAID